MGINRGEPPAAARQSLSALATRVRSRLIRAAGPPSLEAVGAGSAGRAPARGGQGGGGARGEEGERGGGRAAAAAACGAVTRQNPAGGGRRRSPCSCRCRRRAETDPGCAGGRPPPPSFGPRAARFRYHVVGAVAGPADEQFAGPAESGPFPAAVRGGSAGELHSRGRRRPEGG